MIHSENLSLRIEDYVVEYRNNKKGGVTVQCMKCGQDVENGNVFCQVCLEDMKKYPVRPGTVVQLPKHQEAQPRRPMPKRKQPSTLEEQVKTLRKWARALCAALAVTLALLALTGYLLLRAYRVEEKLLPGQNYSAATSATEETGTR